MSNASNNPDQLDKNSTVNSRAAVSTRELISVCRQIGGMMEAGVDILRVTRVLRAQTQNPRLLEWYDQFDHELTMGRGLPEALAQAPDLFSPFAVSLVRQGEERNDLSSAFVRVADFLVKEHETTNHRPAQNARQVLAAPSAPAKPFRAPTGNASDSPNFTAAPAHFSSNAPWWWRRAGLVGAGILGALAVSEALVAAGWLDERWGRVARNALGAGVLGAFAISEKETLTSTLSDHSIQNSSIATAEALPTTGPDFAAPEFENETDEVSSPIVPVTPEKVPMSLQRAPSWDADVDTTRRIGTRPPDEEDFE